MGGAGFIAASDLRERFFVETLIKAGQDDGALRAAGNGREQARGDNIGAGRADRHHRARIARHRFNGARDQRLLARGRVDKAALGLNMGPGLDRNVEKIERDAPIIVEFAAEIVEPAPSDIFNDHFIDQSRQFAGQAPGVGGMSGDQQRFGSVTHHAIGVDRDNGLFEAARPFENEFAQNHPPLDIAGRAGQMRIERIVETRLAALAVERAKRQDIRQQQSRTFGAPRQFRRQGAAGASRRHIDFRLGQGQWPGTAAQARNHRAVEQRLGESRKKRRAGSNGENARRHGSILVRRGSDRTTPVGPRIGPLHFGDTDLIMFVPARLPELLRHNMLRLAFPRQNIFLAGEIGNGQPEAIGIARAFDAQASRLAERQSLHLRRHSGIAVVAVAPQRGEYDGIIGRRRRFREGRAFRFPRHAAPSIILRQTVAAVA